jgi:hypothetical protein
MILVHDVLYTHLFSLLAESLEGVERTRMEGLLAYLRDPDRDVAIVTASEDFQWMCDKLSVFREKRSKESGDFKFFCSVLDAMDSILHVWRTFRFPHHYGFSEQMSALEHILPFLFATGRTVYSRIIPFLVRSLRSLHKNMPDLYEEVFKEGNGFGVPRNPGKSGFLPDDLVHEQVCTVS